MSWPGLGGAGHSQHYPCGKEARRSCLEKEQNSMSRSICPLLVVALHTPAQRLEHVQPRGVLHGARAHVPAAKVVAHVRRDFLWQRCSSETKDPSQAKYIN